MGTRLQQIELLKEAIAAEHGLAGAVLAGDFNLVAYGAEYRRILGLGLWDAWNEGPRLGSRDTILEYNPLISNGSGGYRERPSGALPGLTGPLDYTLDFQLVTDGLAVDSAWTVGRPDEHDPEWVSDHLGIAVEYVVKNSC